MEKFYLLDYLKNSTNIPASKIELLKYELDQRIYYFGEQFNNPRENNHKKNSLIRDLMKNIDTRYLLLKKIKNTKNKCVLSNAYFSINLELKKLNINTLRPMHNTVKNAVIAGNWEIYKQFI